MATIRRFEDIECWAAARSLVRLVYNLTGKDSFRRDHDLLSQIRRSAVSSMANIAEGFHRSSSKDFLKFLGYSRSSVAETLSHGYVALDQGYIDQADMDLLTSKADIVWKQTNSFIAYLSSHGR